MRHAKVGIRVPFVLHVLIFHICIAVAVSFRHCAFVSKDRFRSFDENLRLQARKQKSLVSDEFLRAIELGIPTLSAEELRSSSSQSPTKIEIVDSTLEIKKHSKFHPKQKISNTLQPQFTSLGLEEVGVLFGDTSVVANATFFVKTGERVGLVGPNGIGKSTLLKVMAGILEPTSGSVSKSPTNIRTAFLRQEFLDDMNMNRTLYDELLASFPVESTILREISECEMSISSTVNDMDTMSTLIDKLQQLQMSAEETGAYFLDARLKKAATSVGFEEEDFQRLIGSFSGGWKMRIGLAKILSQDPNILLLDEPTNHLDLESIVWLEEFLRNQNIPMIIVSHDREFLDQVCNKIVEVEDGKTVSYEGNYSRFLELRRLHLDQWRQKFDKQMKLVHEEELWIKSAKNNPSLSTILKSKIVALENLKKSSEWISAPPKDKKFRFRFPVGKRSAAIVVVGKNLSHGYGSGKYCTLFQNVNLNVERGRRVGFVGPNGSGKSTLLRLIMGMETPKSGYVEYGSDNVVASYYAQSQADMLDLESSVLDSVANFAPEDMSITDIRGLLGQFMFKGDDVEKKIKMLSGGEKARVALCRMLLTPANLLILDEPTNHLDICTKEVLEEALLSFAGSIFLVSHDRYFLSQIANTIFEFKNKTISRFDCDYHDYVSHLSHDNYLKDQLKARRVIGDKYAITKAKEVVLDSPVSKSRNFGGSGVTCGNLHKGIKNAKRFIS